MFRMPIQQVARSVTRRAAAARRTFASDAATPEYTGMEAAVRKVLPKDEHLTVAYIGIIGTIVLIAKMTGGSEEEATVVASSGDAGPVDMVPSMFSEKFDEFISQPGNEAAFEKSCDEFEEWMKVPANAAKYEAQFN